MKGLEIKLSDQSNMKTGLIIFLSIIFFIMIAAIVYLLLRKCNLLQRYNQDNVEWNEFGSLIEPTYRRFDSFSCELDDFPVPFTITDKV